MHYHGLQQDQNCTSFLLATRLTIKSTIIVGTNSRYYDSRNMFNVVVDIMWQQDQRKRTNQTNYWSHRGGPATIMTPAEHVENEESCRCCCSSQTNLGG